MLCEKFCCQQRQHQNRYPYSVKRRAPTLPLGTWVKVQIAEGSVCVSPGMLIVAPTSPMTRAEANRRSVAGSRVFTNRRQSA